MEHRHDGKDNSHTIYMFLKNTVLRKLVWRLRIAKNGKEN